MKPYQNSTLGFTLLLQAFATAEEFDQAGGRVGLCVEEANRNLIYRSWNPEFRDTFCEELEKLSKINRKTKVEKKADGTDKIVIDEKEVAYVNRVRLESDLTEEDLQELAERVASGIKLDPSPSTRSKKAPKEIVAAAETIMSNIEAGATTALIVGGKFADKLGIDDFVAAYGEVSVESLTMALQEIEAQRTRSMAAEYV